MSAPQLSLSAKAAQGAGTAFPFANAKGVQAHIYGAAATSCSVVVEGAMTENGPWIVLATATDPGATGTAFQGVAWPWMRLNVSAYASGLISGYLRSIDVDAGPWNSAIAPSNTATAIACTSLTDSGLTATRVPFAGTGGLLEDEAAFAYTKGSNTLAADIFKGGAQVTCNAYAVDGAISVAPQVAMLTQDAVGAYTLAAPTITTHDGYTITIVATKARAHVITIPIGKINGGSNITITLGGAIGDGCTLVAYQTVWWMVGAVNATVAA